MIFWSPWDQELWGLKMMIVKIRPKKAGKTQVGIRAFVLLYVCLFVDSLTYQEILHAVGIEFSAEFSILITLRSRAMLGLSLHTAVYQRSNSRTRCSSCCATSLRTNNNEREQERERERLREWARERWSELDRMSEWSERERAREREREGEQERDRERERTR